RTASPAAATGLGSPAAAQSFAGRSHLFWDSLAGSSSTRFGFGGRARNGEHGLEDVGVGAATAEVAADGALDVVERGAGLAVEQRRAAHDHPGRAEAALQRVMIDECLLHGVKCVTLR